jgi:hypothetical protein
MSLLGSLFGRKVRRCYRCALPAKGTYMGLDYCPTCLTVVPMMMPAVSHDPPFGFPGQRGYDPLGPDPYTLKREGGKP